MKFLSPFQYSGKVSKQQRREMAPPDFAAAAFLFAIEERRNVDIYKNALFHGKKCRR